MNRLMPLLPALILFVCLIPCGPVLAGTVADNLVIPEEGSTQILTLDDGSSLVGRITEIGDTEIKFHSDLGEMTIQIAKIREIRTVKESTIKNGQFWFPNPNQTRMLFGPTGRMLKKGQGYFFDVMLFFPGAAYAITDNFTIGGGMSIFPGLDADRQLYFLTPKIGLNILENVDVAANLMLIRVPVDDEDAEAANDYLPPEQQVDVEIANTVGLLFLTGTYGNETTSLTFGAGFGLVDSDLSDKPALTIGVEHRFGRRVSFVSENWIFPGLNDPLVTGGVRFFGESIAVDLAILGTFDTDVPVIPYIDFVYNF